MAHTRPFFRHVHHGLGVLGGTPGPGRYPYHDQSECPIGKSIKKSGDWQYYLGHPGEERDQCDCCMRLAGKTAPHGAAVGQES